MRPIRYMIMLCCLVAMAACASTFNRSPEDPALKLKMASELFSSKDDPVAAEKLLQESLEAYARNKDQRGLADAYRQFGLFYRSNAVNKAEKYFRERGFLDKTVVFNQRYQKAVEYFNRSKDIYASLGQIEIVSNLYVSLGKTSMMMSRPELACEYLNKGLENYAAYKQANPGAKELHSEEMANYEEYIASLKMQAGCK